MIITTLYNSGRGLKASIDSGNYDNSGDLVGYWKFKEEEKKTNAPVFAEVCPLTTPTYDHSPDYTFSSTKVGNFNLRKCDFWNNTVSMWNRILRKTLKQTTSSPVSNSPLVIHSQTTLAV